MKHYKLVVSLGLLLLAAALFMALGNVYDEFRAGRKAQNISNSLETVRAETMTAEDPASEAAEEIPTLQLDGDLYIGTIEIPSIDLTLPVYSEWDYDKLKNAPCRYSGSVGGNNLIIMAHDYKSHFGPIKELPLGEQIAFVDVDGSTFLYEVNMIQQLDAEDIAAMEQGDWDLTLFTCSRDGHARCTLRCMRTQPD